MTDEEKDGRDDLDEEKRDNESDDYDEETAMKKPAYAVDADTDDDDDADHDESSGDDEADDEGEKADDTDDVKVVPVATKRRKKKRRKKAAAKAVATPTKTVVVVDDDDDDDRAPARPVASTSSDSSSGGGSMLPAIAALVGGLAGGFFIGKAQAGGDDTVDASQDTASAVASATGTNGEGGPCQAYADALCEKLGATSPVCAQAKQASSFLSDKTCTTGISDIGATVSKLEAARGDCDKLVTDLCKELGDDSQSCKLVKEKTPQFPAAQCTKMLENYDQVLKQLQQQEMRNKPLSAEMAKAIAGDEDVPSYGPADAKVTIVEFSDFECPYCARAAKTVHELMDSYPEGVRVVFRQFPLPMHKNAQLAAEASLAAHAQGKFWKMHDKLFENSRNLSRESIEKMGVEIGLDMAKFKKALDDGTYKKAVEADKELGSKVGVSGTPTMIVNTKRVQNPGDIKSIQKLVEEEGGPKAKETKADEGDEKPEAPGAPKAPAPAAPAAPKAPAPAAPKAPAPATP